MTELDPTTFVLTAFYENTGNSSRMTASGVTTYTNGDPAFTRLSGSHDPTVPGWSGKWSLSGGTGKLAGIEGSGTFTCRYKPSDPTMGICEVEANYTLPGAKQ